MQNYYSDDTDLNFNMGEHEENQDFDVMPIGEYVAQAVEVEIKPTSKGNGQYMAVEFEVVSPQEFAGRKIFENYVFQHHNVKTTQIAIGKIKNWVIACGYTGNEQAKLGFYRSLRGIEFLAKVGIEKGKDGYEDKNRIKKFSRLEGRGQQSQQSQGQQKQPAQGQAQQPQGNDNNMPWED